MYVFSQVGREMKFFILLGNSEGEMEVEVEVEVGGQTVRTELGLLRILIIVGCVVVW